MTTLITMEKILSLMMMVTVMSHVTSAEPILEIAQEEWELFKIKFNKNYANPIEEQFRMKIFMENKLKVISHNQLFAQNLTSFKMKTNHLSDMLKHEIVVSMHGLKGQAQEDLGSTFIAPEDDIEMPISVDWRTKGVVTPVKDQGQCGSCWAFSTTGALEGQYARKTGQLDSFSEQNLVDCCSKCNGCGGGLMSLAFQCIHNEGGIDGEISYPYHAEQAQCKFSKSNAEATDTGFVNVKSESEIDLMKAVALVGPIAVAIDANHDSFMQYSSGVYHDPECSTDQLDHAVLAVGYGTDEKYGDYWLVKNSWGEDWGEKGYIRMARNKDNACGIATLASFPLV